ncbi:hypothetical protein BZG36_02699 [Bifiguratus adelaidae]|uniref:EF-hand domain-containing protein n=1 Tax=Bifiguratus adelaidae TaxID=1938954 RepID=A0A261Y1S0_9FUNG|nr:hypothetical protein BZG36_02699 [Bifiguratus adelaidae]
MSGNEVRETAPALAGSAAFFNNSEEERTRRMKRLFNSLTKDDAEVLDSDSILSGIQHMSHLPARGKYARELLERCDLSQDGQMTFEEFKVYITEKERELWELFKKVDTDGDGCLQPVELQRALSRAGIRVTEDDFGRFMDAMDMDQDGVIDFQEWRDFLLLLPKESDMVEIYRYYQISTQLTQDAEVFIPPNDETSRNALKFLTAGGIAGAVSRSATAPFDRLKVYLITHADEHVPHAARKGGKDVAVTKIPRGQMIAAIKCIYQAGGFQAFFIGNGLNVAKIVPESGVKFLTFETFKSIFAQTAGAEDKNSISVMARFAAGGLAGITSQLCIYPIETLKSRIQCSEPASIAAAMKASSLRRGRESLIATTARQMWRQKGFRAFWSGLPLGLIGVFPYQALDMGLYETLKVNYLQWRNQLDTYHGKPSEPPNVFVLWGCGMMSGSVGATSVYPLNMVRTRMQAQGTPGHPQTYTSALDCFRKTYRAEGVLGFYKGLVPTLMKVIYNGHF